MVHFCWNPWSHDPLIAWLSCQLLLYNFLQKRWYKSLNCFLLLHIGEEKHTIYLCVWFSWIAGLLALLDENEHDLKVSFLLSLS